MMYSRITGTGSYLPEKILTNKDLEKMVDTTDEWIFERTGIRERHVVETESASDLAEHAARRARPAVTRHRAGHGDHHGSGESPADRCRQRGEVVRALGGVPALRIV